ncbi:uncharacterized protein PFL1_00616 [Pseudozyma flocculosa PF-1]|uniref:EF-hand domain-containing protein n=1 Tax=Pseudozyma flocculosa TaxID=84751 RepID=A0A5C3EU40_9BASI|nr:uncharacterized protein PFL1_00616 [Pseudozyma flocculosa PF-1]EPQ32420.1 hypothetical protein PFL1_00616 [Pseudozyma flocculosa PF-1]SPO34599.1 uncharacterized protein PSFLO_00070 [Pseudozyma flocculosa]
MSDTEEQISMPAPVSAEEREANDKLKALLINDEGDISDKLEAALLRIFARFSSSYRKANPTLDAHQPSTSLPRPSKDDTLTASDLDDFAMATNGSTFPEEAKEEIQEYLDTDDDGNLTFRGFCEMFHLQSDNEPEETWRDLKTCGFNDKLDFIGVKAEAKEQQEVNKIGEEQAEATAAPSSETEKSS